MQATRLDDKVESNGNKISHELLRRCHSALMGSAEPRKCDSLPGTP
jgi:hypothetical protein